MFEQQQKKITTTIDNPDYVYCKKNGLKFAHLIRAGVRDHRVHSGDPDAVNSSREIIAARDRAIANNQKIIAAIKENLSEDQALEIFKKI